MPRFSCLIHFTLISMLATVLLPVQAQEVVWADSVVRFSSEYSEHAYGSGQVLGPPSVLPAMERNTTAWSPKWPDKGVELITVSFPREVAARQVVVCQTYNPGAVEEVILKNANGEQQVIPLEQATLLDQEHPGIIALKVEPAFQTSTVLLKLNTQKVSGYNHIDAIGLLESDDPYQFELPIAKGYADLEPQRLGNGVNTRHNEVHPIPTSDAKTLFFTRKNYPGNYGAKDLDDTWISQWEDGEWQEAENPGNPLNTTGHNHTNAVLQNGQKVYCAGNIDSKVEDDQLYLSKKTGMTWSSPEKLTINRFFNQSGYTSFHISRDEQVMILSLQRPDSRQSKDLYVTFRQEDGTWSAPKNIGPTINTVGDEISPFITADGQSLYFASDGHPGFGQKDIYMAQRLDNSWTNWTVPNNLGPPVNTEAWEAYFSMADEAGDYFFTRYVGGRNTEIFHIQNEQPAIRDSASITVKVIDRETSEPVASQLEIQSGQRQLVKSGSTISVRDFPIGEDPVQLRVSADGYFTNSLTLDEPDFSGDTVTVSLYSLKEGVVIPLKNIFFEANKVKLKPESFPELNNLASFLQSHTEVEIEVAGHTNDLCSSSYCKRLSTDRARAVAHYLTSRGVSSRQVTYKGYGKSEPIASNETEAGRKQNQRVEVRVMRIQTKDEKEGGEE